MNLINVPLDALEETADNSRLEISDSDIASLMSSIKEVGVLHPIGVISGSKGRYRVILGNRRVLACKSLKLTTIPALVYSESLTPDDIRRRHIMENVIRRDLTAFEFGRDIDAQVKAGMSLKEVSVWLGVSYNMVKNAQTTFQHLPQDFRAYVQPTIAGRHTKKGNISLEVASRILHAAKDGSISVAQKAELLKKAREAPTLVKKNLSALLKEARLGKSSPLTSIKEDGVVTVSCLCIMSQKEERRLQKKYVDPGTFSNITQVLRAILVGALLEAVKLKNRGM
jgi:ParB/RepB/Spo0J family partition protein